MDLAQSPEDQLCPIRTQHAKIESFGMRKDILAIGRYSVLKVHIYELDTWKASRRCCLAAI